MVFICDDIGYTVTPFGGTACIGPVDAEGNALENVYKLPETNPATSDIVLKQGTNTIPLTTNNLGSFETSIIDKKPKHPGGRPRKTCNDVSRTTKWRRQRDEELQGVLFNA